MAGYKDRNKGGSKRSTGGGAKSNRKTQGKGSSDGPDLAFFAKIKDEDEEYGYATIGAVKKWQDTGHLVLDINMSVAEKYVNDNGYVDNIKLFPYNS